MFGSHSIHRSQLDAESLQADVMRFMAIIGFCLLAILALVRNVAPLAEPEAATMPLVATAAPRAEPPSVAPPVHRSIVAIVAQTAAPRVLPTKPLAEPEAPRGLLAVESAPPPVSVRRVGNEQVDEMTQDKPLVPAGAPRPALVGPRVVAPVVIAAPGLPAPHPRLVALAKQRAHRLQSLPVEAAAAVSEQPEPPPTQPAPTSATSAASERPDRIEPATLPPAEQPRVAEAQPMPAPPTPAPRSPLGLVLRFDDDRAFLRLLATRQARLFAIGPEGAWELNRAYEFQVAERPAEVREIAASSLPSLVQRVLPAGPITIGVALPPRTEHDIERLLRSARSGELLITAAGRVRHVGP